MAIIKGTPSVDTLRGGIEFTGSDDVVLGLAGNDELEAGTLSGSNTLGGGTGNDRLFAGADDLVLGDLGDDELDSGDQGGNNTLFGGAGDDTIYAGIDDAVFGGSGNDTIYAGNGNNLLSGGTGNDRFFLAVAEAPTSPNTITDFNAAEDQLVVKLTGVTSFQDLTIEADGTNTLVKSNGTTLAILTNTPVNALNPENVVTDEAAASNTGVGNLRIATFNASLNRNAEGQLVNDLSNPVVVDTNGSGVNANQDLRVQQAKNVAEIIQRTNPDILLINEFDYFAADPTEAVDLFRQNFLAVSQNGATPVDYPYFYIAPSNTGIASGFDLDNNGTVGGGNDAFGFGNFPGQFGMLLLSKYPIISDEVRTFQNFLWKDMPENLLTNDPTVDNPATTVNENLNGFYSPEEINALRLSSKSHWDVPVLVNGEVVHVLAAHPTPPVFDGTEDRNGKRNYDEIRFWTDYITPGKGEYIYDDTETSANAGGGLQAGERFVILGDYNADPFDGDAYTNAGVGAADQFFATPSIQGSPTDTSISPTSDGAPQQSTLQGGANANHTGNPALDTADFADTTPGNLRVDYVLPSTDFEILDGGVYWPLNTDPNFGLVGTFNSALPGGYPSSDHKLVYLDLALDTTDSVAEAQSRKRVEEIDPVADYLGIVSFPTATTFEGTTVGGLSGIVYDRDLNQYYSISDDRSQLNPARFYTLTIDLSDGELNDGDVEFTNVTTLLDANGDPFAANTIDFEGIVLTENGSVYVSSEGEANVGANRITNPSINEFSLSGQQLSELPVDDKFNAVDGTTTGIRNNLAFESLTTTPDGRYLYTATENALAQDGSAATVSSTSLSRIVKYDLTTGEVVAEYVYEVETVADAPNPANAFATNGLVELLAIDNNGTLLSLERSFSTGNDANGVPLGNTVKLYEVLTQGALNVKDFEDLYREDELDDNGVIIPPDRFAIDPSVQKRLLLDFADLGITPDNLEGLSLGPVLEDGRQSLIVVSDNNFSGTQTTQVIALALDIDTLPAVLPTVETPYTIDDEDGTTPLIGDSDDPAVWLDPTNSGNSIVIGTLKDGGLAVFNLDGSLRQTITPADILGEDAEYGDIRYNNVDVLYNFDLGDEVVDIAVASDRQNDTLAIFKINPDTRRLEDITDATLSDAFFSVFGVDDGEATVYGLAGYRSPVTGAFYIFVTQADGNKIAQLALSATGTGTVTAEVVRTLTLPLEEGEDPNNFDPTDYQSEAIVVDQETGIVYVGVEGKLGIVKFDAEPTGSSEITIVRSIDSPELIPDLEGLGLYYGPNGTGYLIASSQGDSSYAVYSRDGDNEYLGSFVVGDNAALGIDQANETDGLDIINVPLGSAFPFGAFLVQDGANDPQNVVENDDELENNATNFKFIPWESVANAFDTPLIVDTQSYNPRTTFQAFPNGVASGDVDQDSAVLWTRSVLTGEVTFEYSTDPNFGTIAGTATATAVDPTIPVKVTVEDLDANTEYYYRVTNTSGDTAAGRFITAAAPGQKVGLTFGVSGGWRGEVTPYPAIRNIPDRNLDFFVALGDTVYADDESPAVLNPDGTQKDQAETIEEFRAKHNEVYSDRFGENFWLEARQSTSILSSIDDHEVTNDFQGGADASTDDRFVETSGFINDAQLYENGLQAYQEYNPLQNLFYNEPGNDLFDGERKLYRYNTYGDDAAVITLDARSFRSENLPAPNPTDVNAIVASYNTSLTTPDRTLLGDVQLEDLKADLLAADAAGITWKFIMIPEPIQNILVGVNVDNYEGFAKERAELLQFIDESNIENVVFIAADIHITTVNNLTYQTGDITSEQIATSIFEITTGSVAYDAPSGVAFAQGIAALSPNPTAALAAYNSLPIAPDADNIVNDKDDFVKTGGNGVYAGFPQPFDPIGLNDNLAQAEGLIDAELLVGDYFVSHSYSWTEFDIDPETQVLTVTTYGIDGYTEEDVDPENPNNRLDEVLASQPTILSQFEVNPNVAPVVENQTFSLAENSLVGAIVGVVAATDANENQQDLLSYSFTEANTRFAIDASTGEITLVDATGLDFEADPTPQFTFEVTVTDPTGLSDTATVTVNVTNVNEPPTITSNNTFSVAENTNAVGTITAIDPDANAVLTYSISGADAALFTIAANGALTFNAAPDFENPQDVGDNNIYNLQVQVSDGNNTATQDLTVTVTDGNEAPVAQDATFSIAENSLVGTVVDTVSATDPEGDVLTYSIDDDNNDRDGDGVPAFVIDEETGTITVFDDDELDFEVNPSFALILTVVDAEVGGLSDTATITINLTDVNEAPVVENQTFSLVENSDPDTVVGVVAATDQDANTNLTYSITAGNTDVDGDGTLAFAIDSSSGEITVNDSGDLDFENAVNTFDLTVQVSDGELSDTAIATINLTDTDDVEIISEDPDTEIPPRAQTIEDADTAASYLLDIFSDLFEDDPSALTQVNAVIAEAGNRLQDIVDELTYLLPAATTATALATLRQDVSQAVQSAATRTNAAFNNLLGFYVVTDALTGAVQGTNGDEILPGDPGYAQAALANVDFNIQVGGSQTGAVGNVTLVGDTAYAPFVIANGAQFASDPSSVFNPGPGNNPGNERATAANFTTLPVVYFGFIAANPDLAPHIKRLQGDIFGFEDLPAGVGVSDYDFNDGTFTFG